MKCTRHLCVLLLVAILLSGLGAAPQAQVPETPTTVPGETVVVRLYVDDRADLDRVAGRLDIWEVHYDQGFAIVAVGPEQYAWLEGLGYRLEIDTARTEQMRNLLGIPGYLCYRTVEETYATLQQLATDYPDLTDLLDIGNSWEKWSPGGLDGYDLYRLRITNQAVPGPKPTFLLMAEIHAREYGTAEIATRFAEYLLHNYGTDPEITFFVDYHNIDIVPMDNPDGRKHAETGEYWRKNTDSDDGCSYSSSWGVDLNRNYAFKWSCCGGSSGDPCDETYRGPSAASEPETQAIQNLVMNTFPDQRGPGDTDPAPDDATGLFITLHSAAALVLWPWGWTGTDAPNGAQLQTIGQKLATYNGYTPQQSNDLYTTDGTTDDWTYGNLGIASFTYELSGTFFEPCSSFESTVYPDNLDSLLYAMKIPDTPYLTVYGPDALDAAAVPGLIITGDPVQITTTLNDEDNGDQTIQAAEYYIVPLHADTPPGAPGTGLAMQPADGNWGSTIETVVADIDTSSLGTGTYLLAVRGQDAGDHWGPFTAAFLIVAEPGVSPVIEGTVLEAGSLAPLEATVTAGMFQAATDPATGYYSMTVISDTYDIVAVAPSHAMSMVTGIVAENYQTVHQDFELMVICDFFEDDVEAGNQGWTPQSPWSITIEASHSSSHSWTESAGGNYGSNRNVSLTSQTFDLSQTSGVTLSFWHIYDTEPGYDYGRVEYSINGGSTWTTVASYDGYDHTTWTPVEIYMPQLDGQANARIRFRFTSDGSAAADGWHIDDIILSGGGPSCQPCTDVAGLIIDGATLGEPGVYTFTASFQPPDATPPIAFTWDNGDTTATTTRTLDVGAHTLVVTATNCADALVTATHTITVEAPPTSTFVFLPIVVKH